MHLSRLHGISRLVIYHSSLRSYCSTVQVFADHGTFRQKDLRMALCKPSELAVKPDWARDSLKFGAVFSDHMMTIKWNQALGWGKPKIGRLQNLSLHPAAKVLHYAIELFEGMKAYRGVDNQIRMFRPELNAQRMNRTAARASLPTFDEEELIGCIEELVSVDREWVPYSSTGSLYIRPTLIGTGPTLGVSESPDALLYVLLCPVSAYFESGFKPVSLYADPQHVRAWPGGAGAFKMGSNYAPTILICKDAANYGCSQVLWLHGEKEELTEVGTMNIFVFWINEDGEHELITPSLDTGVILPGVTRQSMLDLAREWNEFKVTEGSINMRRLRKALRENRLLEFFGSGTACTVCPVDHIMYRNGDHTEDIAIPTMEHKPSLMQRFCDSIADIQYGRIHKSDWCRIVS